MITATHKRRLKYVTVEKTTPLPDSYSTGTKQCTTAHEEMTEDKDFPTLGWI